MNANEAKCLVVSKVLVADGMMADGEREFLAQLMQTLGLTDEEPSEVRREGEQPRRRRSVGQVRAPFGVERYHCGHAIADGCDPRGSSSL